MSNGIKNQWLVGVIIAGVIVAIFVVFNYQGSQESSLSDIFPEDATTIPETEYEFVTDAPVTAPAPAKTAVKAPVKAPVSAATLTAVAPAAVPAPAAATVAAVPVSGTYSIQVLSSKDKVATDKALEKIKAKGHAAYIVTKDLGDKGIWYRINVGSFASKQEAENYLPSVKNDYKDGFIVYTK